MNVQTYGSTAAGTVTVWPSDESMPGVAAAVNGVGDIQSNLVIVRPGSDGKIKVNYTGGSGSINVTLDVQGYFTNAQAVGPPIGTSRWRSGSRADSQPISRTINDRTGLEVTPRWGTCWSPSPC